MNTVVKLSFMLAGAVAGLIFCGEVLPAAEAPPQGVATAVVVRVVGNHAMVLGDTVGGAAVTIRDAATGAILASGTQTGSTGDLRSIMQTPHEHIEQIYSVKGAASFTATLHLTKPTLVEVTGEGPLKFPRVKRRASKTVLLYPGKHVTGDGIVLVLYGLLVRIESPTPDRPLGIGDGVTVRTTINMMCDCIVEPFGNWDSRKMELFGEVRNGDTVIGRVEFFHQGPTGLFQGDYTIPRSLKGKDRLTLRVVASDKEGMNVGYDEITYHLVPWEQSRDATGREIPPIAPPKP